VKPKLGDEKSEMELEGFVIQVTGTFLSSGRKYLAAEKITLNSVYVGGIASKQSADN
jgi:hypothetical protein